MGDFDAHFQALINTGCIDNGKRIWWDIRPHPFFSTIEFRICDMPAMFDDIIAIAALCQALVAKLTWLYERGMRTRILSSHFISKRTNGASCTTAWMLTYSISNRVAASACASPSASCSISWRTLQETWVAATRWIICAASSCDPRGTEADRQIALFEQTGSTEAVTQLLIQQTVQGILEQVPRFVCAD